VIEEPESKALQAHLGEATPALATSRIALVEVVRAVGLANPSAEARREAVRTVEGCLLVDASESLLRAAAGLTSASIRTLDAIHLASANRIGAGEMLVYDARLQSAAEESGIVAVSPGRVSPRREG
jgi:predicted nucleic acid-binding protein